MTSTPLNMPVWEEDVQKQVELRRMKRRATGLLGLVALVFASTFLMPSSYWIGLVRATAEAAMVGAVADWFAVTALFRHPLGLKIPHTAIIPRKKDLFGERLGQFVQQNFLSDEIVTRRLGTMHIAETAAQWLSRPENSRVVADLAVAGITGVIRIVKDEEVQALIEHGIVKRIEAVRIAPVAGRLLALFATGPKQQDMLAAVLRLAGHIVEENEETIRRKIVEETPWWLPVSIDGRVYQRLIASIERLQQEVRDDPDHPVSDRFRGMIAQFIEDLQRSPEMIERGEALKTEVLNHPAIQAFSSELWTNLKTVIVDHAAAPDSTMHDALQRSIGRFGEALMQDGAMQEKINRWLEDGVGYLIRAYGHEIGKLIAHTVQHWDAEATSRKIELQVGRDLQFIRINGTIVGGMVGLGLYILHH